MTRPQESQPAGKNLMHPHLQRLIRHYASATLGRSLPPQSAFQPNELTWLYGCFCTVEVLHRDKDYRFQVCGEFMRLICGHDLATKRLSEVEDIYHLGSMREDFDHVLLARRPRYSDGEIVWDSGTRLKSEWLIIPFTGERGAISMLLMAEKTNPLPEGRKLQILQQPGPQPHLETRAMIWPAFHGADRAFKPPQVSATPPG